MLQPSLDSLDPFWFLHRYSSLAYPGPLPTKPTCWTMGATVLPGLASPYSHQWKQWQNRGVPRAPLQGLLPALGHVCASRMLQPRLRKPAASLGICQQVIQPGSAWPAPSFGSCWRVLHPSPTQPSCSPSPNVNWLALWPNFDYPAPRTGFHICQWVLLTGPAWSAPQI